MINKNFKETYKIKSYNSGALNAGVKLALVDTTAAEAARKNNNLPFNTLNLANLDANCTLFVFLDDATDEDIPDFVLFPQQQISFTAEEGINYNNVWIKNTSAASNIAAKSIKWRISTVKEIK